MTSKNEISIKAVGLRLKNVRKSKNLGIEAMGKALNVTGDIYYNYETGKTMVNLEALGALRERFDISMDWILFNRGPMSLSDREVLDNVLMEGGNIGEEMKSFLLLMNKDPVFKYQQLGNYYEYLKSHPVVN